VDVEKTNFSEWTSEEIGVKKQTSAKAPQRKLKKVEKDSAKAAMEVNHCKELSSAIRADIAHITMNSLGISWFCLGSSPA
jgi:hypothetical protein